MKPEKQSKIIEYIRQGASWEAACLRSQTRWTDFLDVMKKGQDFPNGLHGQFVRDVYESGRWATENQLWNFKKFADADGSVVAVTEYFGGHAEIQN